MGAIEGVLKRKEEVKRYYQSKAAAGLPGTSQLFAILAEDEERHGTALRHLEEGAGGGLHPSATLEKAKFLLRRMEIAAVSGPADEVEIFGWAMDSEAASASAYRRLAQESSGARRELFMHIAAEEEMHFTFLEHLRELLDPA